MSMEKEKRRELAYEMAMRDLEEASYRLGVVNATHPEYQFRIIRFPRGAMAIEELPPSMIVDVEPHWLRTL